MAQQKSITLFFRKKREFSDVDENDDVKEVNHRSSREADLSLFLLGTGTVHHSETSENTQQNTGRVTVTGVSA